MVALQDAPDLRQRHIGQLTHQINRDMARVGYFLVALGALDVVHGDAELLRGVLEYAVDRNPDRLASGHDIGNRVFLRARLL